MSTINLDNLEEQDKDVLTSDLLNNISDDYDKTIGYLTHDLCKSLGIELEKIINYINQVYLHLDVDNLDGSILDKWIEQRKGIKRKLATSSTTTLTLNGSGTVNIGNLFETEGGIQFQSLENKTFSNTTTIKIESILKGSSYNVGANTINQIPVTIEGIVSCNNNSPSVGGFDAENDNDYRDRYYLELQKAPTSGNIYHYEFWAKEVVGVGGVRVIPLWNGNNTVKVVIIDSNRQPASTQLVDAVQKYIDPKTVEGKNTWGTGTGVAPIGAYCTVESATKKDISIEVTIKRDTNYSEKQTKDNINEAIIDYLKLIAFSVDYLSYAKVNSVIINTDGVVDITSLKINNNNVNIPIANTEVSVLSNLVVNYA